MTFYPRASDESGDRRLHPVDNESLAPENSIDQEPQMLPTTTRQQVIVLVTGFIAVFQTIGPNLSYGVFQDYYTSSPSTPLPPSEATNTATIAFIGTLGAGLTWGGSIYVNPLMSRSPNNRLIPTAGALLMSAAFALASLATHTWHLLLTQGLLYGVGASLLYFPLVAVAPEYFSRRRGAAMGVVLSAAGLGGLCFSPATRALLAGLGPRWTLRVMALQTLVVSLPAALWASPSRSAARRPTLVSAALARKPAFALQCAAALLQAAGNFVPMTFALSFSAALGYSASFGAALLALNNGVNAVSRVVLGAAGDALGRQNTLVLSVVLSGVSVLALWSAAAQGADRAAWVLFVVVYGLLAGGYMALFPVTISDVFGIQAYASVNGVLYFARGLGAAFGSPVGGAILGESRGLGGQREKVLHDYRKVIWYDGALLLGSGVCVVGVRAFDALEKRQWRWKA